MLITLFVVLLMFGGAAAMPLVGRRFGWSTDLRAAASGNWLFFAFATFMDGLAGRA